MLELLTEDQLSLFTKEEYRPGEYIARELDRCEKIFFIQKGEISISSYSLDGKEIVMNYLTKGTLFGNVLSFTKSPYLLGDIICKKECQILVIAKSSLLQILSENKMFLNAYLEYICEETIKIKKQAKLFSYKKIEERIMYYLHTLSLDNKSNTINIKSVTNLAYILCLPRESVSRSLTQLILEGYIAKNNNEITIL
ncbi:MAG: Crp/Fnr family transcriptional regulator [Bacilli bacterium]